MFDRGSYEYPAVTKITSFGEFVDNIRMAVVVWSHCFARRMFRMHREYSVLLYGWLTNVIANRVLHL